MSPQPTFVDHCRGALLFDPCVNVANLLFGLTLAGRVGYSPAGLRPLSFDAALACFFADDGIVADLPAEASDSTSWSPGDGPSCLHPLLHTTSIDLIANIGSPSEILSLCQDFARLIYRVERRLVWTVSSLENMAKDHSLLSAS